MKKYIIRPGDTMNAISQKTGVKLSLLMAANPQVLEANQLYPGQTIVIPELGKPTTGTVKPSGMHSAVQTVYPGHPTKSQGHPKSHGPTGKTKAPVYFGFVWPHVVTAGETWETIARKYHVSLSQLMHLNPKYTNGKEPKAGKVVFIPSSNKPQGAKKAKKHRSTELGRSELPQANAPVKAQHVTPPKVHAPHPFPSSPTVVPESFATSYEESSSLLSSWDAWDTAVEYQEQAMPAQPKQGIQFVDTFEFQEIDVDHMHSPLLPYMHIAPMSKGTPYSSKLEPPSYPNGYVKVTEYDEEGWSQTVSLRDDNERTTESD